jgi:signal transduction histidine kinase
LPITVTAKANHDDIEVSVHNEGSCIPEQEQRVIFDPLRRAAVKERQESSGTAGLGLGLYIARQIAEAHGGVIDVDSAPDRGTSFVVRLPRKPKASSATAGMT